MNKSEWKKQYSEYRQARFDFEEYMQSSNFPCGHDDMLYENFADNTQKWLSDKPELKQVLDIMDSTDIIEWRADDLSYYNPEIRAKYLKIRLTA
jgi:hypothetical protein